MAGETGDVFVFSWVGLPTAPYDYDGGSENGKHSIGSMGPGADSLPAFDEDELNRGPTVTLGP